MAMLVAAVLLSIAAMAAGDPFTDSYQRRLIEARTRNIHVPTPNSTVNIEVWGALKMFF